ncbi:DMT family transporter [Bacillus sp. V5-8f]|uniref:DMT family transporter n=1 Tax=Bacillus sp. V5-8f TaxID=2053044 RepID=UPI000C775308|nr:DMT family transporter [Bacillus sp. V5-8f]PLT35289.1 EamA family transporter [Bacillus sp. V5-8f]
MYLLLVIIMVVWGLNVPATKILVDQFMPVTITALRIFTAGITVFVILYISKLFRMPMKKEIPSLILGSVLNVAVHHYFLAVGLRNTTAVNGGIILGLGPMLTAILSIILLGSRFTVVKGFGFVIGFAGVLVIVLQGKTGFEEVSSGDLFIFISILSQALSFILIKRVSKSMDPRLLTGYMLVIGSFMLLMMSLIVEPGGLKSVDTGSALDYIIFFASAILATAIGHMTYNYAIGKIGAAESAIFMNLPPFFSLSGSALLLNEHIYPAHLIGLIFIIAGVVAGSGAYKQLRKSKHTGIPL